MGRASWRRDGEVVSAKVSRVAPAESRLDELYQRHAGAAVRLAYLLLQDRSVAEDIVQDAFVRVAGRLVHLRDPGAFDAYLRRTVVNLSRSYVRRKMLERSFLKRESAAVARDAVRWPTSSLEDREVLWRALGRLSERQRAAIVLRFYEDLPEIQVAEILRCRPGTVKSLVSRGLKTLRHEMRGEPR
jgi:RNA polymerase sigma-70 factor (sigma-E family)